MTAYLLPLHGDMVELADTNGLSPFGYYNRENSNFSIPICDYNKVSSEGQGAEMLCSQKRDGKCT